MASVRWFTRSSVSVPVLGIVSVLLSSSTGLADRIVLRGGGQVRGKVVADPAPPGRVIVLPEQGKTPLTFQKSQVLQVIAEPGPMDEYVIKRAGAATTA